MLQGLEAPRRKAAALQADLVDAVGARFTLGGGQGVGQHVLSADGAPADESIAAHVAELMNRGEGPYRGVVLHSHVPGERGCIREEAVASDLAVVADVGAGHEETVAANARNTSALYGASRDSYAFADDVIVAHFQLRGLTGVADVLRRNPNGGEGIEFVSRANGSVPVEHHVGDEITFLAENNVWPDGAVGADRATRRYNRRGSHDGSGVNAHSVLAAGAGDAAACLWRGTSWHMMTASHASLPSTLAVPSMRQAFERQL